MSRFILTVAFCACASMISAAEPSFRWLVDPVDNQTMILPSAVSADGQVILGRQSTNTGNNLLWSDAGGTRRIPDLLRPGEMGMDDISADGSVVVGTWHEPNGDFPPKKYPIRWTEANGTELLSESGNGGATAVSADGRVILLREDETPYLWTDADGATNLTEACELPARSWYGDLSGDGAIVALADPLGDGTPDGVTLYGVQDNSCTVARDPDFNGKQGGLGQLSDNGTTLIGSERHGRTGLPFRWNAADGYELLSNSDLDVALNVSADGSVVIGNQFIWDTEHGYRTINDFAEDILDTPLRSLGISYLGGIDISADGRTIVGIGGNTMTGRNEGFILTVPEPASWTLGALGIAIVALVVLGKRCPSQ